MVRRNWWVHECTFTGGTNHHHRYVPIYRGDLSSSSICTHLQGVLIIIFNMYPFTGGTYHYLRYVPIHMGDLSLGGVQNEFGTTFLPSSKYMFCNFHPWEFKLYTLPCKETLLAQRRSNALTGVSTNSYVRMNSYSQSVHIHQPKNCMIFSNIIELVNSSSQGGWFHQPKS